jgi:hypothetical protein
MTKTYPYCTYDRQEITAWLARGAAARVFVNFRKFSPCIARAARPRMFDSLPSLSDVGNLIFRWILPFSYFCFLLQYKSSLALYCKRKQKYQNGNIHRKLKVPTSERESKLPIPRARHVRGMHGENLRKFTKTRAAAPRASYICIDFAAAKSTVLNLNDRIRILKL